LYIDDEMKRAENSDDELRKSVVEDVYKFMNRMEVIYGYYEDEDGIIGLNLTNRERDKAVESFIQVLRYGNRKYPQNYPEDA
jgi:hypothetical protein